ncbi:hypothetical protein [Silvimonas soli]|uniref:terminase small subunit-like protein n=1 Tax=Silvimonas soli TaxID=2980100 RepID=UPI0024B37442|nr:hypothetical protein [Silvimonas soli]
MARPTRYTNAMAERICERLMGGESLRRICKSDDTPDQATVYRWLNQNKSFREQYTRAREVQADTLADEIIDIADDGINDSYVDEDSGAERTNYDVIARSKLRVDARKWLAGKMAPKKYGEKIQQELSGPGGEPLAPPVFNVTFGKQEDGGDQS